MELLSATSGEGSQDTQMERSAQLSCSVKEEPDADGQEMGENGSHTRSGGLLGVVWTSIIRVGIPGEIVLGGLLEGM